MTKLDTAFETIGQKPMPPDAIELEGGLHLRVWTQPAAGQACAELILRGPQGELARARFNRDEWTRICLDGLAEALGVETTDALRRYALEIKPWTDRLELLIHQNAELFEPLMTQPPLGRVFLILQEAVAELKVQQKQNH